MHGLPFILLALLNKLIEKQINFNQVPFYEYEAISLEKKLQISS